MENVVTKIPSDIWDKLGDRPSGDQLVARLPFPEINERFYCALDSEGNRHFLILLSDEDGYADERSRGLKVSTRSLVIRESQAEDYIDVECLDRSGIAAFDLIGGEMLEAQKDSLLKTSEIVESVLAKWRRFWGRTPVQMLSEEAQIGLFAELWFFSKWLYPKFGAEAILAWRGPMGSRHDYEWEDKSVEVKATRSTRGRLFHINGFDQLDNPERGPLYFFGLVTREEAGASSNLSDLVDDCRGKCSLSDTALDHFENALIQSGYTPYQNYEYMKLRLRIWEQVLFQVRDDFPRVTRAVFDAGLPAGVENISYEINLNVFNHLLVADKPEGLPF